MSGCDGFLTTSIVFLGALLRVLTATLDSLPLYTRFNNLLEWFLGFCVMCWVLYHQDRQIVRQRQPNKRATWRSCRFHAMLEIHFVGMFYDSSSSSRFENEKRRHCRAVFLMLSVQVLSAVHICKPEYKWTARCTSCSGKKRNWQKIFISLSSPSSQHWFLPFRHPSVSFPSFLYQLYPFLWHLS